MTILDAVPPEGSEITVVQLRLAPLSFTHWNSSRFLESFNYVMHCWRWNIQISFFKSNLSIKSIFLWGTLFLNISIIFSRICWQTGDPLPIFAPKGLDLSWMLLLYQIIITITCCHQLFCISPHVFTPKEDQEGWTNGRFTHTKLKLCHKGVLLQNLKGPPIWRSTVFQILKELATTGPNL